MNEIERAIEELKSWKEDEIASQFDKSIRPSELNRRFMEIVKSYSHEVISAALEKLKNYGQNYQSWYDDDTF